jgi:GAF domain-containing protein
MSNDAVRIEQLEAELRLLRSAHAAEMASLREEIEHLRQGHVTLVDELDRRNRELTEALAQQTATADILRAIASSSTQVDRVLNAINESALLHSHSTGSVLNLREGDVIRVVALAGTVPRTPEPRVGEIHPITRSRPGGRAILERRTIHIPDSEADEARDDFADLHTLTTPMARLTVPLLREDEAVGVLHVMRDRARHYSVHEIALVEAFAHQAAIAIENARLFEQVQETGRQLAEASRHKSQFLANMSHELRTPLNAIIGYSEMLQEEAEDLDADAFLPDLRRINAAGKHLLGLINDILDLSKIEAGRLDLFLETFEIGQLVRDVEAIVRPLVEENGNTLVVSCPDDIGTIQADLTKVRQALFNLLSNAAKFTDHGTVSLTVQRERDDWLTFAVSDTGSG